MDVFSHSLKMMSQTVADTLRFSSKLHNVKQTLKGKVRICDGKQTLHQLQIYSTLPKSKTFFKKLF